MKRPATGWPDIGKANAIMNSLETEITKEFRDKVIKSYYDQTVIDRANALAFHRISKEFAKEFDIDYSKKKTME